MRGYQAHFLAAGKGDGTGGWGWGARPRADVAAFPPPLRGRAREGGAARDVLSIEFCRTNTDTPFPGLPPSPALPRKGGGSRAEQAVPIATFSVRSRSRCADVLLKSQTANERRHSRG